MNYFIMGGPLFMGILTLVGVAMLVAFFLKKNAVKQLGLLALAVGVLGQMIGLFGAFEAIESVVAVHFWGYSDHCHRVGPPELDRPPLVARLPAFRGEAMRMFKRVFFDAVHGTTGIVVF